MTSRKLTLSAITLDTCLFDSDPIWAHERRAQLCQMSRDAKVKAGTLDADCAASLRSDQLGRIESLRQSQIKLILERIARENASDDDMVELENLRHPSAPQKFL